MTSISILENRLNEIERTMNKISANIKETDDEIESSSARKRILTGDFNKYDEETVEIRESIVLLKESKDE